MAPPQHFDRRKGEQVVHVTLSLGESGDEHYASDSVQQRLPR